MTYTLYVDLPNLSCRQSYIVTSASEIVMFTLLQSMWGLLNMYTLAGSFSVLEPAFVRSSPPTNSQTLEVATIMCMSLHLITTYSTHKKCNMYVHTTSTYSTCYSSCKLRSSSLTKHTKIIKKHQDVSDFGHRSTTARHHTAPFKKASRHVMVETAIR